MEKDISSGQDHQRSLNIMNDPFLQELLDLDVDEMIDMDMELSTLIQSAPPSSQQVDSPMPEEDNNSILLLLDATGNYSPFNEDIQDIDGILGLHPNLISKPISGDNVVMGLPGSEIGNTIALCVHNHSDTFINAVTSPGEEVASSTPEEQVEPAQRRTRQKAPKNNDKPDKDKKKPKRKAGARKSRVTDKKPKRYENPDLTIKADRDAYNAKKNRDRKKAEMEDLKLMVEKLTSELACTRQTAAEIETSLKFQNQQLSNEVTQLRKVLGEIRSQTAGCLEPVVNVNHPESESQSGDGDAS